MFKNISIFSIILSKLFFLFILLKRKIFKSIIESDLHEVGNSDDVKFGLNETEATDDTIDFETPKQNEDNKDEVFEKDDFSCAKSSAELNDDKKSIVSSTNSSIVSCYLCIKVNKNKDFINCPMNRKMKNRLTSEFWFQINDNRLVK